MAWTYKGVATFDTGAQTLGGNFDARFSGTMTIWINDALTEIKCRVDFDSSTHVANGQGVGGGFINVMTIGWVDDSQIYSPVMKEKTYGSPTIPEPDETNALSNMDNFLTQEIGSDFEDNVFCEGWGYDSETSIHRSRGDALENSTHTTIFQTTPSQILDQQGHFVAIYPLYLAVRWLDTDYDIAEVSFNPMSGVITGMTPTWNSPYYPWGRKIYYIWESLNSDIKKAPANRTAYFRRKEFGTWAEILNDDSGQTPVEDQMAHRKLGNPSSWVRSARYGNDS